MSAIANISERISIKSFMLNNGFSAVCTFVRENSNGYPYITFLRRRADGTNEGENVYFSKRTSETVAAGTPVDRDLVSNLKVAQISYSDGRPTRWKLVSSAEGENYQSIDDLF